MFFKKKICILIFMIFYFFIYTKINFIFASDIVNNLNKDYLTKRNINNDLKKQSIEIEKHIIVYKLGLVKNRNIYRSFFNNEIFFISQIKNLDFDINLEELKIKQSNLKFKEDKLFRLKETKNDFTTLRSQQQFIDQIFESYEKSRVLWEKGEIDNALKCLDETYSFILTVNNEESNFKHKDDLRLMISKRIMEISASKNNISSNGINSEIPMIRNEDVQKEIHNFQTVEKNFFIRSYQRSIVYRPIIVKYLKEAGLPEELSWLPLVESGFSVTALSRARALGLWQFIPSTGHRYSLYRDHWIDERMDIDKSTKAAIAYLKELHGIFGDWLTCLAAYNCGEGRVLRVISKQHINYLDHFWDLYRKLPHETARYVPRFLATLHIVKNPTKYGIDLDCTPEIQSFNCEIVKTSKCMRIQDIASAINVSKELLTKMNSELKLKLTPNRTYDFKVPIGGANILLSEIDDIPEWESIHKITSENYNHSLINQIKKEDTINRIAQKFKFPPTTSFISKENISSEKQYNSIQIKHKITENCLPIVKKIDRVHKIKKSTISIVNNTKNLNEDYSNSNNKVKFKEMDEMKLRFLSFTTSSKNNTTHNKNILSSQSSSKYIQIKKNQHHFICNFKKRIKK